jgi:hypothetical protein
MTDQPRFTLQPDGETSWLVIESGHFIGGIDHIGEQEFLATHLFDDRPASPVPIGPHRTLEAAFEAFTSTLS